MSGTWIELLRRGYEAFNRGEVDETLALFGPGFEGRERDEAPEARHFAGEGAAAEAVKALHEEFEDYRFEPEEFEIHGDRVLVCLRQSGRGRISGVPVEGEIVHLWRIRDDKAVALLAFSTKEQALAALAAERAVEDASDRSGIGLVRAWCEAVNGGDFRVAESLFDPAVEFTYPDSFPGGGTYRGLEEAGRALESELDAWEEFRMDLLDAIEEDDRVVAAIRESGRGRASGVETEVVLHSAWTVRDGSVTRVRFFEERADALRDAGIDAPR